MGEKPEDPVEPQDAAERNCDIWLWDGAIEYEGVVTKLSPPAFVAHLREARKTAAPPARGRRFNTTFFDLQRQFVGCRFLAFCKPAPGGELQEVEITSVQRSMASDFDFFVCGRFWPINERQKEMYRKMSARGVGTIFAERLARL